MTKIFLLILITILLANFIYAEENKTCIYFFYGNGCPHCAKVEPLIKELEKRPDIEVQEFEIYNNTDNSHLLSTFFTVLKISDEEKGIPAVFISKTYLTGDVNILNRLEKMINEYKGAECPTPESIEQLPVENKPAIAQWQIAAIIILTIIIVIGYLLYQKSK